MNNYESPHQPENPFTMREIEILRLIADGLPSKQIADKLGISENTVVNHRCNMLKKTGANGMAELMAKK